VKVVIAEKNTNSLAAGVFSSYSTAIARYFFYGHMSTFVIFYGHMSTFVILTFSIKVMIKFSHVSLCSDNVCFVDIISIMNSELLDEYPECT